MLIRTIIGVTCVAAALVACASAVDAGANTLTAEAAPAEMSEKSLSILAQYQATGETVKCISARTLRTLQPLSDNVFLVRSGYDTYYINRTASDCEKAGSQRNRLSYQIDGSPSICEGEVVIVETRAPPSITVGSCSLGPFELVSKKAL